MSSTIQTRAPNHLRLSVALRSLLAIGVLVIVNGPNECSSFQAHSPQSISIHASRTKRIQRPQARESLDSRVRVTKLESTAQNEEELIAAVEDGSIDIETLKEMLGEDFDLEDYDDEEEDYDEEDAESEEFDVDENPGNDDDDAEYEADHREDDEEEVDEAELLLQFVGHIRETPIGELDVGDAELIREILGNFPVDGSIEDDGDENELKASYLVEYLLHRSIDEWRDSVLLLEGDDEDSDDRNISFEERQEREQIFRPVAGDFYDTMLAISKDEQNNDSPDVKAARIWKLLSEQRELVSFFEDDDNAIAAEALFPNHRTFEVVLNALSLSSDRGVDRKASIIVEEWIPRYQLFPTPGIYGPYIKMIAKARHQGAARKAEKILRKAVQEYPPNDYECPIGVEVFNVVVTAYAKARGESYGPERAQELIVFMDTLGNPGCAPNAKTFTSLVDAYAQTNDWDSVYEAQQILNNLLNQYLLQEGEGKYLEPSVATWTIVIAAWMRLSRKGRTGAAKRAGDLLRRMESLSSAGKISAKPDAITYVTVFNAYASSRFQDEIEKAEELLDEMNEIYLDGDDSFRPSVRSIKILVEAWIKADAIDRAEKALSRYEDLLIEAEDNESENLRHTMSADDWKDIYKSLLTGHTRLGNPKRATSYLNLMIENEGMEPDSIAYEKIIESYTRLGGKDCGKKTQEIFQLLEKRRKDGAISPNERVYTSFIRALSKAKVPGLHKKADLVLQRMHSIAKDGNTEAEPTIFTYNAVLNACSECVNIDGVSHQEAFQTSVRIFTDLRKQMDPDHVTFGNTIRCANLLSSDSHQQTKDKFIAATFKLCCESGDVNNYFIRDLARSASNDIWTSLTGFPSDLKEKVAEDVEKATLLVEKMPASWRRKAANRQKPTQNSRIRKY